ncbi:hypothetical protein NL393_38645, partial [Klebsiella pneumoniae]|nr:hypothetical protein [Klebsiella pneumoniae]
NNERDVEKWTYSVTQLGDILKKCLKERAENDPKFDAKAVYKRIMQDKYDDMPEWTKKQCWNMGIKMKGMTVDPRKGDKSC